MRDSTIRTLKVLLLGAAILAALGVAGLAYMEDRIFRAPIHVAVSPSGRWTAQLHRLRENDPVPYGDRLVLYPAWSPLGRWWSTVLYQGSCANGSSLAWRSDTELVLSCGTIDRIQIQETKHEQLRIEYVRTLRRDR